MDACPMTLPPVSNQTSNLDSSTTPRGLGGHLTACIVGAGIDNLFRQVAIVALSAAAVAQFPNDMNQADQQSAAYGSWALMLFSLPFIILAPLAGSLGDRIPKHHIIRATLACIGRPLKFGILVVKRRHNSFCKIRYILKFISWRRDQATRTLIYGIKNVGNSMH